MKVLKVYHCFCDETRLRILNLLLGGPLCVCHLSEILEVPQPKVSRHLKALRGAGALETVRCYNWTICRLPQNPSPLLQSNLQCLQDLQAEEATFQTDLKRKDALIERILRSDSDDLPAQIKCLAEDCC